nr:MAG TPA: Tai4 [Caudoviricetes sp.]
MQKRFGFAKIFLKINPGAEQNNKLFVLFALVLSKALPCKPKRDILALLPK